MDYHESPILDVAALVLEAAAMVDAALALDLDEARSRAQLIATEADDARFVDLALAAAHLVVILGQWGRHHHWGTVPAYFEAYGAPAG